MGIKHLFLSAFLINLVAASSHDPAYNSDACVAQRIRNRAGKLYYAAQQDGDTPLTSALCRSIFKKDQDYFSVTHGGKTPCPKPGHAVDATLNGHDNVLAGANFGADFCTNYNWQKGSKTEAGEECNPDKTKNKLFADNQAPLILGFGGPINVECGYTNTPTLKANPDWTPGSCTQTKMIVDKGVPDENTLTKCCMKSGKIYHRLWLGGKNPGWSFCENYRWVMCGAAGFMKNQKKGPKGGGTIKLVTAASEMMIEVTKDGKPKWDVSTGNYSVTIHEFCTLDRVCKNTNDLWSAKKGSEFTCEYNANWKTDAFERPGAKNRVDLKTSYASEIAVQVANMTDFFSTNTALLLQGVFLALVLMQLGKYWCRSSKAIENEYMELLNGKTASAV